ncbi:MAG: Crp/Fnr family transcriptional regulator [Clostridia bacterium]
MKNYFEFLKSCPLFSNISHSDLSSILCCLDAKEKTYQKNEVVLLSGDPVNYVGVVISGSVKIVRDDVNGNQTIVGEVSQGEMFAESFACAEVFHSPVSIITIEKTQILLCDYRKVITTCSNSCVFHNQLIENMLKIIANKNIYLNQKINIISKRTLREKIVTYLEYVGKGEKQFTINLNREEMANYLCADRSALSNELSKMQKDGLIRYSKNSFEIIVAK